MKDCGKKAPSLPIRLRNRHLRNEEKLGFWWTSWQAAQKSYLLNETMKIYRQPSLAEADIFWATICQPALIQGCKRTHDTRLLLKLLSKRVYDTFRSVRTYNPPTAPQTCVRKLSPHEIWCCLSPSLFVWSPRTRWETLKYVFFLSGSCDWLIFGAQE